MGKIGHFGHFFLHPVEIRIVRPDDAQTVAHGHILKTVGEEQFGDRDSGRTGSVYNDLTVLFLLSGHTQTIDDTGENNDGGSVLVIMKYGNVKLFI